MVIERSKLQKGFYNLVTVLLFLFLFFHGRTYFLANLNIETGKFVIKVMCFNSCLKKILKIELCILIDENVVRFIF